MAATIVKARCVRCEKEKATSKCEGCLNDFCFKHLGDHRQELSRNLDDIDMIRDSFQHAFNEQKLNIKRHVFIEEVNQWEKESIRKIQEKANEVREQFVVYINKKLNQIENKLNKLTEQLRESREEDDFYENDLNHWNKELTKLNEQLSKPNNIVLQYDQIPFINKISVNTSSDRVLLNSMNIKIDTKWSQYGTTTVGEYGKGSELNQLNSPMGIHIDDDNTIYIADSENNRIIAWESGEMYGRIVAGGNGKGSQNNQLNYPTNVLVDKQNDCLIISDSLNERVISWSRQMGIKGQTIISNVHCHGLAMDRNGYIYVSDIDKHEVKRWRLGDTDGMLVAGGNGQGCRLDQLDNPRYLCVDHEQSVYVSDWNNHRVMKWIVGAKVGILIAGSHISGNGFTQLYYPRGILVDQLGTIYVVDSSNHRIMRWLKGSTQGEIIVHQNGGRKQDIQLYFPTSLSFDLQGNIYVANWTTHRIQSFNIE